IIGEHGQHAVYIPRVEPIVDARKELDITIQLALSLAWRTRCVSEKELEELGSERIPRQAATRASRPPDKSTLTPIPFEMKDQIAARTMLDVAATYDLLAERAARGSNLADEA